MAGKPCCADLDAFSELEDLPSIAATVLIFVLLFESGFAKRTGAPGDASCLR